VTEGHRSFRESTRFYDAMVGFNALEHVRENFERLCFIHSLRFDSCADIACGTGLFVEYICSRAITVFGVDVSPEMLEAARARNAGNQAVFFQQDFVSLQLPEQVDLVTCNFDSLNYLLSTGDLQAALVRFARSLAPGGHAVFDMNTPWQLEELADPEPWVHEVPGGYSIWETAWDPEQQVQCLHMINLLEEQPGLYRKSEEFHRERGYSRQAVESMLHAAGFAWWRAYDAAGLGFPGPQTRRLQFIAGMAGAA